MATTENDKEQQKPEQPDFVKEKAEDTFGKTGDKELKQENFPSAGNQSQTGAATNNSDLDIEPLEDGDDSLTHPDD